jgi:hypothetical protein
MDIEVVPLPYERQMALAELVGYANQSNDRWHQAVTAGSVRRIGETKLPYPQHPAHIRAVIAQLGDEGMRKAEAIVWAPVDMSNAPEVEVSPLTAVERWDLADIADAAHNLPSWKALASIACSVRKFVGVPLEFPKTKADILDRVKMLGFAGMGAASAALRPCPASDD